MADSYARYALSQRAAFEVTHPAALATARLFADEPVLRVVDLGAADGVNSHGLIRDLMEERTGRPLIYAFVDLPTNAWAVAADHLRHAFGATADGPGVMVIPEPGKTGQGVADVGTGAHWASPEAHGEACSTTLTGMTIPPGSHSATSRALTHGASRSCSVRWRSRARTAPAVSSLSSWPSLRSAWRMTQTVTAGTTWRPS
jgi:hypothetical protein